MSQMAVEQTLGRLLTDAAFRRQFFEDPCRASFLSGLKLSPEELEALGRIPRTALAVLGRRLDDRICRLCPSEDSESSESKEQGKYIKTAQLKGSKDSPGTGGSDELASH